MRALLKKCITNHFCTLKKSKYFDEVKKYIIYLEWNTNTAYDDFDSLKFNTDNTGV